MLKALPATRQNAGEARRAWYFSSTLDLYVWFGVDDAPCAFELSYKTRRKQDKTACWHHQRGYRHWRPGPVASRFCSVQLLRDNAFDNVVAAQFLAQSAGLPVAVVSLVLCRLAAFELPAKSPDSAGRAMQRQGDASLAAASNL